MKPELKEALQEATAKLESISQNLRDIHKVERLVLSDIAYQAEKLDDVIREIQIHGGGTGEE